MYFGVVATTITSLKCDGSQEVPLNRFVRILSHPVQGNPKR